MADLMLVNPLFLRDDPVEQHLMTPYFPLGLLYLASTARDAGYKVSVFDAMFQENDNAFYVERDRDEWTIRRRKDGRESRLSVNDSSGDMRFESDVLALTLSPDWQLATMDLRKEFEGSMSLAGLAEMSVILQGIVRSSSFPCERYL